MVAADRIPALARSPLLAAAVVAPLVHLAARSGGADPFTVRYVSPMIALFFLWSFVRARDILHRPLGATCVDLLAVLLAASRLVTAAVPVSGHALFLAYTLLTTPNAPYRVLAALALIDALIVKLSLWGDGITPLLGFALAAGLAALHRRAVADSGQSVTRRGGGTTLPP